MVKLQFTVLCIFIVFKYTFQQMISSDLHEEQKCAYVEQRILGILHTEIFNLKNSVKEAVTKMETVEERAAEKDANLQTKLQNLQTSIDTMAATINQNQQTETDVALQTTLQQIQSSVSEISERTNKVLENVANMEISTGAGLPTNLRITLENLESFVQTVHNQKKYAESCARSFQILSSQPQTGIFQQHCYFYGPSALNWHDAQIKCQLADANLVTVSTFAIQNYLDGFLPKDNGVWIGGTDIINQGTFRWVANGRNISAGFMHWDTGKPDNAMDEDCVEMMNQTLYWNDISCDEKRRYVCEIEYTT